MTFGTPVPLCRSTKSDLNLANLAAVYSFAMLLLFNVVVNFSVDQLPIVCLNLCGPILTPPISITQQLSSANLRFAAINICLHQTSCLSCVVEAVSYSLHLPGYW